MEEGLVAEEPWERAKRTGELVAWLAFPHSYQVIKSHINEGHVRGGKEGFKET